MAMRTIASFSLRPPIPATRHTSSSWILRSSSKGYQPPHRVYSSNPAIKSPGSSRPRFRRVLFYTVFGVVCTSAGFIIATAPAISGVLALMSAPSDAESAAMYQAQDEAAAEIDKTISEHPVAQTLRADPRWTESRPHLRFPEAHKKHSLTAGTLLGPGRVPVPPLVFTDDKNLVSISYLGSDLCGHVGMVHGGMLATILDEALGRCSFSSLPNHIGVTAYLTVNYRKATPSGSYVLIKAETTKVEGRKAWVKGTIELLGKSPDDPRTVLVEAEGLFVEPKYAKMLPRIFQV